MRWKTVLAGLALGLAATIGCKQQCYINECDLDHYKTLMPANLEVDPGASIIPSGSNIPAPATVLNPEREIRYLSLSEAIAMALEAGTPGSPTLNGTANISLGSFQGRSVFAPEVGIRVLALDPAIVGADIDAALSKFDARWTTTMSWTTTDRPVGSPFEAFQVTGTNINTIQTQDATLSTALLKPLPTGGVAGVTFRTDYENTNLPARVNPSYRPNLQFQFEQPLLQGFGVEINQLRQAHPGSILTPFQTAARVEGILISRIRFDQIRAEFERQVNTMLANVEVAYWNLYGSYWTLYSREQALRQAYEAWKINKERFDYGRIPIYDLAQTRAQYESFRGQRITALTQVLDNERALRILIGLPVEDGKQIVPIDQPTLAPYQPDWLTSLNEALALRPELELARQDLKFRQLDLINNKNLLLPDLRFAATYDINGIGSHLGGGPNDPRNALADFAQDRFNDWQLELRAEVPIGFRDAHAAVRAARLNIARSYAVLKDQELRTQHFLALQYTNVIQFYQQIEAQRSQRIAAGEQLEARFREFLAGRGTLDFLLEAQRVWADALRDEFAAIVNYNNSMAQFEFAKGTIMQHDNVTIAEGGLPCCAQVRAVDHFRERSKALILRERALPIKPACAANGGATGACLPVIPSAEAPSVPAMMEGETTLPKVPETLPMPTPTNKTSEAPVPNLTPAAPANPSPAKEASKAGPTVKPLTPSPATKTPVRDEAPVKPAVPMSSSPVAVPEPAIPLPSLPPATPLPGVVTSGPGETTDAVNAEKPKP
jgi:outer membrane protein TolC